MRMLWTTGVAGLAVLMGVAAAAPAQDKIRVVIIDGQNNHNWQATTPVMKTALESCGRFIVDVATTPTQPKTPQNPEPVKPKEPAKPKIETPENLKKYEQEKKTYESNLKKYVAAKKNFDDNRETLLAVYAQQKAEYAAKLDGYRATMAKFRPDLKKYDVVLSNYNGDSWPKEFQSDLDEALKSGKIGLVIVHAANNSFGSWLEYNKMIGMGWRDKNYGERLILDDKGNEVRMKKGVGEGSGHRYGGQFTVTIRDTNHPITRGMPLSWMHASDELYDNMRGPIENVHLLATAYSKGTQAHEPMIWTVTYGKGRVFHTPMGHDANAMRCIGFIGTLQRGTEWAATGSVSLPLPSGFPTAEKSSSIPAAK